MICDGFRDTGWHFFDGNNLPYLVAEDVPKDLKDLHLHLFLQVMLYDQKVAESTPFVFCRCLGQLGASHTAEAEHLKS